MADRTVAVKFTGDARDASRAIKQVKGDLDGMGVAGQKASGPLGRLQDILTTYGGSLGQKASGAIDGIVGRLSSMPPAAAAATAGVGALAAGIGILAAQGIQNFVDNAAKVRDFGRAAGTSAEQSSKFVSALDDMEISSEAGAKAMFKLAKGVGDGSVDLDKFGASVTRTKDGTVDMEATFLSIADAYNATHDPAQKAALLTEAFGKAGQNLIPIMEKGSAGIRELFANADLAFSQKDLDAARQYELAMDKLGDSVGQLQREMGGGLVPVMADFVSGAADAVGVVTGLADNVGGLGNVLGAAAGNFTPWGMFGNTVDGLSDAFDFATGKGKGFDDTLVSMARGIPVVGAGLDLLGIGSDNAASSQEALARATQETANQQRMAAQAAEEQAAALTQLADATLAAFNSELQYENALDQVEESSREVTDATNAHAAAVRAGGEGSAAAVAAEEALGDALRGARGDYLSVAAAAVKKAEDEAAASGSTLNAQQKTAIYRAELQNLAASLAPGSPLRAHLDQYIASLNSIPSTVNTVVTTSSGQRVSTTPSGATVKRGGRAFQHGGTVPGSHGEAVPILAHGGEVVLPTDVVDRIKDGRQISGARMDTGSHAGAGGMDLGALASLLAQLIAAVQALANRPAQFVLPNNQVLAEAVHEPLRLIDAALA